MQHRVWLLVACAACGSGTAGLFTPRPVSVDAIRKACAMEVSCLSPPPLASAGDCVTQFELGLASGAGIFFGPSASDLDRIVGCASSNGDCASALACASRNHGPNWCATHSNGGCDGNVIIFCLSGWGLQQQDCGQFGLSCREANGAATCTNGNACMGTEPVHCVGSQIVQCNASTMLESSIDCAVALPGSTCMTFTDPGGGSTTGCFPAGGGCSPDGVRCDGTTGVTCQHGRELRVACGDFGSHCVLTGMGASASFNCVPNQTQCTSQTPDSCMGSSLVMCVNGQELGTQCSSIGFTSCQAVGLTAACH